MRKKARPPRLRLDQQGEPEPDEDRGRRHEESVDDSVAQRAAEAGVVQQLAVVLEADVVERVVAELIVGEGQSEDRQCRQDDEEQQQHEGRSGRAAGRLRQRGAAAPALLFDALGSGASVMAATSAISRRPARPGGPARSASRRSVGGEGQGGAGRRQTRTTGWPALRPRRLGGRALGDDLVPTPCDETSGRGTRALPSRGKARAATPATFDGLGRAGDRSASFSGRHPER